ncbi:MAG: PAS domain-containing methyl-accepting chemotaxis protein [Rhodoferax sp.]
MRLNHPVTGREFDFPPNTTLLSTTDPKGRIVYANSAFIHVSGFRREELMGQPHNIVRHPDMPPQAFADMLATIKDGQPWRALVKNRRANGDHYWVSANATPMRRNGQLVGYLSVRTPPARSEVQAAEALYARFRQGSARGLAFYRGLVVRTGLLRVFSAHQLLPTKWRILLPLAGVGVAVSAALLGTADNTLALALGLGVLWGALALAAAVLMQQITRPLSQIVRLAQEVATGETPRDLNLNRCDDIGIIARSINQAGLNLQSLVADVLEQAQGVQTASGEIAAASADLSSRTEQAAASLEETASAMEEQTASVQQNSEAARRAGALVAQATQVTERGGQAVLDVQQSMSRITEVSQRISDIIGVIDGIAFQTNILALNAAVEAARAGEQGRGFAVVASEVRSLAGRSASAAKEIKALIEETKSTVDHGSDLVARAASTMTEVVDQVKNISTLTSEIISASGEQATGITEVGKAVSELDQMTQQNAAMVEQSSAAAASLSEQAQRLVDAVSVFANQSP